MFLIALATVLALAAPSLEVPSLPPIRRDPQVNYFDRSGVVIGVRGGRFAPPVDLAKLPPYVPAAVVAIEDRRFYEHPGFDALGMARAVIADLGQGRAAQGASTITQQLARNLYLSQDRTFERKAQELVYAVELEQAYSKRQILGLYLSRVYFGAGAYGIEAAAQRYFGTSAEHLTLREAATLAALLKSPVEFSPIDQPERSAERARLVLDAMVETGAITTAQRAKAERAPLKVWKTAPTADAQYFVDWLEAQRARLTGPVRADEVVETSLDEKSETVAGEAARDALARFPGTRGAEAALVAIDSGGSVRAMIGGLDYAQGPFNRAVDAHRQAGSAWKPFVYLAAMEAGRTPQTMETDEPVTIAGWSPRNFEPEFLGPVTLETALAHSINTVAARLADEIGRQNVANDARRLGIVTAINTDPAMALGTSLVTPLEMSEAYAAFASGGAKVEAHGIEQIRTATGKVLWRRQGAPAQAVIANPPLSEMNEMLRGVIAGGTGARAGIKGYDLAGKTGTTSDFKDAWFCGFTGNLTTVVWLGRDDNAPMAGITGGSAPAAFWRSFMTVALRRLPVTAIPPGAPPALPPPVLASAAPQKEGAPAPSPEPAGQPPT